MAQAFYTMTSHEQFNNTLWRDVQALGIEPRPLSDVGHAISRTLKKRFDNDPDYRERLRKYAENATRMRMEMLEEDPNCFDDAYRRSAETRRRMMQDDPEFRELTLSNLAKGPEAIWGRAAMDPSYMELQREKRRPSLERGRKTIMKRAEKRREALMKRVIEPEFGGLDEVKGQKALEKALRKHPGVLSEHYGKTKNLLCMLKKDLKRMRDDARTDS